MEKNNDLLYRDLSQCLYACSHPLAKTLFPEGKGVFETILQLVMFDCCIALVYSVGGRIAFIDCKFVGSTSSSQDSVEPGHFQLAVFLVNHQPDFKRQLKMRKIHCTVRAFEAMSERVEAICSVVGSKTFVTCEI